MVLYVGFVPEHCQKELTGRGLRLGFLEKEDMYFHCMLCHLLSGS
jgi:hypothetical protein